MTDFIVGLVAILALIGLVYLGIRGIIAFCRVTKMACIKDSKKNAPNPTRQDLENYQNDVNCYGARFGSFGEIQVVPDYKLRKEIDDLNKQLEQANKEIEGLTKGRVLYEKLVLAQLQLHELHQAYRVWLQSERGYDSDKILRSSFDKVVDTSMLKRYVADELRVLADTSPIDGNHLAQARILLAASEYENSENLN